jgi:hypothetical protein
MTDHLMQEKYPNLRRGGSPRLGTGQGWWSKDREFRIGVDHPLRSRTFKAIVDRLIAVSNGCRKRGLPEQASMLDDLRACMVSLREVSRSSRDEAAAGLIYQANFVENDFFRMARVTPSVGAVAAALEIEGAEDQFRHLFQRVTGKVRRRGGKPNPWPLEKLPAEKHAPLAIQKRFAENARRQESEK